MKAVWSGSISWGLVNIPIKLYTAVESTRADFRMLCKEHQAPIHYKRMCEEGGEEVQWGDIVSGLELGKDDYFILTRDEIDKLKPGGKENFEIIEFVHKTTLNPIYYDKSYFVVPTEKSEKAYFLFRELMEEMGLIAFGKFVMKNKEYICALQPYREGMLLYTLHYHQYVRDIADVVPAKRPEIGTKERELGKQLIEKYYEKELRMEEFRDTFMDRLKDLVRRKLAGEEIEIGELPQPKEESLLKALKASVGVEKPAAASAKTPTVSEKVTAKAMAGRVSREYTPMLCETGVETVLDENSYIFEPKLDGTRCIAEVSNEVKLINRRGRNISNRYPLIMQELKEIPHSCVLDGEIVCFNEDQVPDFSLLQKREQIASDLISKPEQSRYRQPM